jgi:hypothetical protein
VLHKAKQSFCNTPPLDMKKLMAGNVEEILRGEDLSFAQPLDPCNYLIPHGLHHINLPAYLEKVY